jgi:hypothetical protein
MINLDLINHDFYYQGINIEKLPKEELVHLIKFLILEKSDLEKKYFDLLRTLLK